MDGPTMIPYVTLHMDPKPLFTSPTSPDSSRYPCYEKALYRHVGWDVPRHGTPYKRSPHDLAFRVWGLGVFRV